MWYSHEDYSKDSFNVNEELLKLDGELDDTEAAITLVDFLRGNLGFAAELLTGLKLAPYQEITIRGLMNRNYSLCVWGRGCGKSTQYISSSKLLTKEHGLIPITELFPNVDFSLEEERTEDIKDLHFWNGHDWKKVSSMLIQRNKKCATVYTSRGHSLGGSTNHLIKCIDRDAQKIVWKRYHELTTDDHVCIERKIVKWGEAHISNDQSYLTGVLLGDGTVTKESFKVTSEDAEIINFCINLGASKVKDKRTKGTYSLNFPIKESRTFRKIIPDLGFEKSYTKSIPQTIFRSSESLKHCLSGLFDTDGCVEWHRKTVSYCSASKELATQVHTALLTFGIVSKLREKKTKSKFGKAYIVDVSGVNALKFFEEIGFRIKRKQKFYEKFKSLKFNTNVDIIPGAKAFFHKIKKDHRLPKIFSDEWRDKIRKKSNQKELTYSSVIQHLDFFDRAGITDERLNVYAEILNENFFFDKIEKIEFSEENCLDFCVPDGQMYWSNGFISHNTFVASVYCLLQAILEPNSRIIIAGPTFRTSRFIFNKIEEILGGKKAILARQAFGKPSKRADIHEYKLSNGSGIAAIPLSGEKIRGFRANILVIDEYLLMSEEIIETVLKPFLTAPQDIGDRQGIVELEEELISKGLMRRDEMTIFEDRTKMIGLSSASYTFENLFETYKLYTKKIYNPKYYEEEEGESGAFYEEGDVPPKYFVSQLAWNAIPKHMMNKSVIKEAESGGANSAIFQREYCAQFSDGSEGFFSAKKMKDCTVEDGHSPTIQIKGNPDSEYILAIDPSFSNAPTSDDFAMSVMEIDKKTKTAILVHAYGQHGKDLKEHIQYFHYLITNFNIVYIPIDNAGYQFLDSYNESQYAREANINIKFIDYDSSKDDNEERKIAKREHNLKIHRIANKIVFSNNNWIRQSNEHLQGEIDYKKMWFAARAEANPSVYNYLMKQEIDFSLLDALKDRNIKNDTVTKEKLIDEVGFRIGLTRKQCAMIEVRSNPRGTQTFDLPLQVSREQGENRARRDNYTSLLIGMWGAKSYFEFTQLENERAQTFVPFFVG